MSFWGSLISAVGAVLSFVPGFQPIGLALMAVGGVVGGYEARREAKKARQRQIAAYNAQLTDRLETVQAETAARRIVLGRVRVGGVIADATSTGTNKETLYLVVLLAGHRVQAIEDIWFDETKLTLDGSGNVQTSPYLQSIVVTAAPVAATLSGAGTGSVTLPNTPVAGSVRAICQTDYVSGSGTQTVNLGVSVAGNVVTLSGGPVGSSRGATVTYQYASGIVHARITKFDGTHTTTPAVLAAAAPTKWTANHKLLGQAFIVCTLTYNADVFPQGLPKISATVAGALVLDPRTSTTAFSENPALLLAHYATHPLGGRLASTAYDTADLIAAANVCDTTTNIYTSEGTAQKLFTAAIMADSERRPAEIMDELAEAMAGRWAVSSGVLIMRAGALGSTVATITEDWLAGGASIRAQRPRQELANTIRGTYASKSANWQMTQFDQVQDATALAAHGAELLQEVQFEAVTRGPQCQFLGVIMLRELRQGTIVQINCNMRAYPLQVFDVVAVTLARYGWTAKLFEVTDRRYTVDAGVQLTLRETAAAIYAQDLSFSTADLAPNTGLPNPFDVPALTGLTVTSGTGTLLRQSDGTVVPRMLVSWTAPANAAVTSTGKVEVRYGLATDDESLWRSIEVPGSETSVYLSDVRDLQAYIIKIRARTSLVRGAWSLHALHIVSSRGGSGQVADWRDGSGVLAVWDAGAANWDAGDPTTFGLPPGSVGAVQIVDGAVTLTAVAPGAVDTDRMTAGASTDVLSVSGGPGSVTAGAFGSNIAFVVTMPTYTNTLSQSVNIIATFVVYDGVLTNTAATCTANFWFEYTISGGGGALAEVFGVLSGTGTNAANARTATTVLTLPAGASLTSVNLRAGADNITGATGTATATWASSALRIEVIKR